MSTMKAIATQTSQLELSVAAQSLHSQGSPSIEKKNFVPEKGNYLIDHGYGRQSAALLAVSSGGRWTYKHTVLLWFVGYLLFCFLMIVSPYMQASVVYLHQIRYPWGDLGDLKRFDLTLTRNVRIPTELKHIQHLMQGGARCLDGDTSENIYGYHLLPPDSAHSPSRRLFSAYLSVHTWEHTQLQWSQKQCSWSAAVTHNYIDVNDNSSDTGSKNMDAQLCGRSTAKARSMSINAQLRELWDEFYDFELRATQNLATTTWGKYIKRCVLGESGDPSDICGEVTTTPEYAHLSDMYAAYAATVTTDSVRASARSTDERMDKELRVIIYLHGNGGTRAVEDRVALVKRLAADHRAHVLTFDYSYFGDSDAAARLNEHPTELSTFLDTRAVVEWVLRKTEKCTDNQDQNGRHDSRRVSIYLYGHSLGTGIAVDYLYQLGRGGVINGVSGEEPVKDDWLSALIRSGAELTAIDISPYSNTCVSYNAHTGSSSTSTATSTERLVAGLVLDSPFSTLPAGALDHPLGAVFRIFSRFKTLLVKHLVFRYNSLDKLPHIVNPPGASGSRTGLPVLIMHSKYDGDLPFEHALRLYDRVYTENGRSKSSVTNGMAARSKDETGSTMGSCTLTAQDIRQQAQRKSPYHQYIEQFYGQCFMSQTVHCAHHAEAYLSATTDSDTNNDMEREAETAHDLSWGAILGMSLGFERFAPVEKRAINCRLIDSEKHSSDDHGGDIMCPLRLVQVAHTNHNSVYRSQQWSQHLHDYFSAVSSSVMR